MRSISHPRESDEWKGVDLGQKYEFFAPIWRIMRDDNMAVEEVRRQIEFVALSVKRGSEVTINDEGWAFRYQGL